VKGSAAWLWLLEPKSHCCGHTTASSPLHWLSYGRLKRVHFHLAFFVGSLRVFPVTRAYLVLWSSPSRSPRSKWGSAPFQPRRTAVSVHHVSFSLNGGTVDPTDKHDGKLYSSLDSKTTRSLLKRLRHLWEVLDVDVVERVDVLERRAVLRHPL
jgi:hypothetical protein